MFLKALMLNPPAESVLLMRAVAREHSVTFAVVGAHPVREHLRGGVRTSWLERRVLVLRRRRTAEHLTAGGIVEARFQAGFANAFEKADRPEGRYVRRVFGNVEAHTHVT